MSLKINPFLVDKRVVTRNIQAKRIERNKVEEFLDTLPDLESSYEDIGEKIYGDNNIKASVTGDYIGDDREFG